MPIVNDPAAAQPKRSVCVIGVPDEYWGETIKAVVVLTPGQTLEATGVVEWCRERLAGFKRPR